VLGENMSQISNQSNIQNQNNFLIFEAPCCASVRECSVRKVYVVGIRNGKPKILRAIDAVRCSRGITKKIKFYPSNDVVLVEHYVSNRGNHYIKILWKPEGITEEQAKASASLALGITEEEVVM
jgi:hypothetical protein